MNINPSFRGNSKLKGSGTQVNFEAWMIDELVKCQKDPLYFIKNYMKIVHVDKGLIGFDPYDYQVEILEAMQNNRRVVVNMARQSGKCVSANTMVTVNIENEILHLKMAELHEIVLARQNKKISRNSLENHRLQNEQLYKTSKKQKDHVKKENLHSKTSRKFLEVHSIDDICVLTPSDWEPISHFNVTIPYQKFLLEFDDGSRLECADDHILIDSLGNETYAKDALGKSIRSRNGCISVTEVIDCDVKEIMYDLTVNSNDHTYYTNNVLSHNTTVATAIILHYVIFNNHKTVALLANKADTAREILHRIKLAYEELPFWLQHGVEEWNKGSIFLENKSKIFAGSTSSSSIRGSSISLLYIDEAAHIEGWEDFRDSVMPTITSGNTTKMLQTSTPNGLNHFFKTCDDAIKGKSDFKYIEVTWERVPGRDEAWKKATLADMNFDHEKFEQEYCARFLGSSGTLIEGSKLKNLVYMDPVYKNENLKIFEPAKKDHIYTCVADTSRGKGLDYSAFSIFDITEMPYKQVCTFRDNMTTPSEYAQIINIVCRKYNNAYALIENNDLGAQVSDELHETHEYEYIIYTENAGRLGKKVSGGFGGKSERGVFTSRSVKASGCSILKMLIEQDQLIVNDYHTIEELKRFSKKADTYQAESGAHDDMVMGLVLFAWLSTQQFFKDLSDVNTLESLRQKSEEQIENEMLPLGFNSDDMMSDNIW